ncbi:hypothetical protein IVA79_34320 [Bradyrhizobium sp. 138]|uniref:hypothetical protein n=1 Tax=Bradyrhizobium sp. 138 TaxID=2782615 RepID=UPI001FFB3480|nr:hypothetical protein [Bradyrhizobium sp. 138]MCK1738918.1 hypothetical protein [Bradyrhizobium sp. 138]
MTIASTKMPNVSITRIVTLLWIVSVLRARGTEDVKFDSGAVVAAIRGYQFMRRIFLSYEEAELEAERSFASSGTEYLIEDGLGPISYRVAA